MNKRKEIAQALYNSDYIGCGCCADSTPDHWDDEGNYIYSETAHLSDEWGMSERYILIAGEILAALGETE